MCEAAVCFIEMGSESRLTQLHGRAATELKVHHRDAWKLTNKHSDTGRTDRVLTALRWCVTNSRLLATHMMTRAHSLKVIRLPGAGFGWMTASLWPSSGGSRGSLPGTRLGGR